LDDQDISFILKDCELKKILSQKNSYRNLDDSKKVEEINETKKQIL